MLVRMRNAWAVAGLCAALMLAGVLTGLGTAGASAAGCPGKVVHLFDPGDQDNIFMGVAAVSACDIWEVGKSANSNSASPPMIDHFDGTNWTASSAPSPGFYNDLNAVSATSASDAWAVGTYTTTSASRHTLILHWDGSSWKQVASPPGIGISSVSALSPGNAWAVGEYLDTATSTQQVLILHWDGTSWTQDTRATGPGSINFLFGVHASSANDVWAVGYSGPESAEQALILHYDGQSWTRTQVPALADNATGSELIGVHGDSAGDVWAVGDYTKGDSSKHSLILHFNGGGWVQAPGVPSPGSSQTTLSAVSAVSPGNAWAVGGYNTGGASSPTLLLHWDGSSWAQVASPSGTSGNHLNAVATGPDGTVWTAGMSFNTSWVIPRTLGLGATFTPPVTTVPSVIGMTQAAATAAVQAAGLLATVAFSATIGGGCSPQTQGNVFSMAPAAGSLATTGYPVLLTVCSLPPQPVPDLGNDTISQARQQLGAAGFTLNNLVRTVIDPTCTSIGRVMSQNPGAGVVEPIGTVVSVTVGAQDRRHPCQ